MLRAWNRDSMRLAGAVLAVFAFYRRSQAADSFSSALSRSDGLRRVTAGPLSGSDEVSRTGQ